MTPKRLPSFNDFSPKILGKDIRKCLQVIADHSGNDQKIFEEWAKLYFNNEQNKRSSTNIPATLRSTGLIAASKPLKLSLVGEAILQAPSEIESIRSFCAHLIQHHNGDILLRAISGLNKRGVPISKKNLAECLKIEGITNLSTNTTDHSTMKNWMVASGLISKDGTANDAVFENVLGVSSTDSNDLAALPLAQQVFLSQLRREHVTGGPGPFSANKILRPCLEQYPDVFDEAQFAKKVREPLVTDGWIEVEGLATGAHGGKSGKIKGSSRLLAIPLSQVIPDFESAVPADLRARIDCPLSQIKADLFGNDTHLGGLALELLALRIILDLGLNPKGFRVRSKDSAHAEVDLIAEGSHLLFSRWTFQCKRHTGSAKVSLSDVAKEVGIALYVKAHVIVMVTTGSFTADARKYADAMTSDTTLQFLFVDGKTLSKYLTNDKSVLLAHARANAAAIMERKRSQASGKDPADTPV